MRIKIDQDNLQTFIEIQNWIYNVQLAVIMGWKVVLSGGSTNHPQKDI